CVAEVARLRVRAPACSTRSLATSATAQYRHHRGELVAWQARAARLRWAVNRLSFPLQRRAPPVSLSPAPLPEARVLFAALPAPSPPGDRLPYPRGQCGLLRRGRPRRDTPRRPLRVRRGRGAG